MSEESRSDYSDSTVGSRHPILGTQNRPRTFLTEGLRAVNLADPIAVEEQKGNQQLYHVKKN